MSASGIDYQAAGYRIRVAPVDSWRTYDTIDPDPGYFEFDWLSARHPDLYDRFASSTDGLMQELRNLVDLSGLVVCDVGAGTGRSAIGAAATARRVNAVDAYESVVRSGEAAVRRAGLTNGFSDQRTLAEAVLDHARCQRARALELSEAGVEPWVTLSKRWPELHRKWLWLEERSAPLGRDQDGGGAR